MRIAFGTDHAGLPLREAVVQAIEAAGHQVLDFGTRDTQSVDYPDYALAVGRAIQNGEAERGVLLCGSGVGISIAACKLRGIRAGVCHDVYSAHQAVEHDSMNVLCLGSRVIGTAVAAELVTLFVNAKYTGEARHQRRLDKVTAMESPD